MADIPKDITYSSVASLRSLRMVIFLAELKSLELCPCDIGNAYLEAYTGEKVIIIVGPEFGPLEGQTLLIVKLLHDLQSSGAHCHSKFADTVHKMDWFLSNADPNVWMKDP
jgi:hypothetical protein